ncbi:Oidioi.mRNA.OKI2018_I69.PAR.g8452.t1.cds [Oikopleura dioica]|uniref:Oidioi.mRNA.OKI2018_I69.PAR.g8452.t1.cds n=1 Tax=Oikopleura dioica TaxID=34765 RepID=A0ABN7RLD7_OIKDI|nr:Oidioi.mRNA.OKI2018_I69.PAR.g8452.t1.cds [Oikopleura dioica]
MSEDVLLSDSESFHSGLSEKDLKENDYDDEAKYIRGSSFDMFEFERVDQRGRTPLHIAISLGHFEIGIWEADQADKNMFGRTNNILAGYSNKAVLALPDIPMLEGCRKAAVDRQVAVSILFRFVALFP